MAAERLKYIKTSEKQRYPSLKGFTTFDIDVHILSPSEIVRMDLYNMSHFIYSCVF